MKKYITYIGILVIGLLLGWVLFSGSSNKETEHNHNEETKVDQMWTCSMHPQIMQTESGSCPICGMDLIPAETDADGLAADQFKLTKNAMALANIQTTVVGSGKTEDNRIKLSGKIIQNEEANAVQVSYFSGRIERLAINFTGEEIRKGQLLATIYSPELIAAQQELLTTLSLKDAQPDLYKAVRNKLKLWKLSENQINQIETSGKVKENFPVYATVSGTVSEKLVAQGENIKQGQPLLKIANLNIVWANFDVYENQISLFKKGQHIEIVSNAYADKIFSAKVSFIDPVLNSRTRTVNLRAVLNNKNNMFKPGMFVEGTIKGIETSSKKSILIPATSVLWTGKRSIVYVKASKDQPVFEMREITLGKQMATSYEVVNGLNNGDEIVTNGTFTIDAAAQLQGKKSMMNKDGDKTTTGHEGHSGMQSNQEGIKEMASTKDFGKEFSNVMSSYLSLKDALVKDDGVSAQKISKTLKTSLTNVDMSLLKGDAHTFWMSAQESLNTLVDQIVNTHDISIQRKLFINLSQRLTNVIKSLSIKMPNNEPLYIEYCPMVDDNKGAYWLSLEKEIKNPYFGKAMLQCGEVKETI